MTVCECTCTHALEQLLNLTAYFLFTFEQRSTQLKAWTNVIALIVCVCTSMHPKMCFSTGRATQLKCPSRGYVLTPLMPLFTRQFVSDYFSSEHAYQEPHSSLHSKK